MTIRRLPSIFREQFSCTHRIFLAALSVSAASCIGAYLYLARLDEVTAADVEAIAGPTLFGVYHAHTLFVVFLLFAFNESSQLGLSMPPYLLRLPIGTPSLVAWRMFFGVFATAALATVSTLLVYGLFGPEMEAHLPFLTLIAAYPLIYIYAQTIAWCIGSTGIVFSVFVMVGLFAAVNGLFFDFEFNPFDVERYSASGLGIFLAVSFACAVLGVSLHRNGRLAFLEDMAFLDPFKKHPTSDGRLSFQSPEHALRWYEYRRQARLLPRLVTVLTALLVVYILVDPGTIPEAFSLYPEEVHTAIYASYAFIVSYGALAVGTFIVGGIFTFQNRRANLGPDSAILFHRPVSSRAMAWAKMAAYFRGSVMAVVPLAVTAAVALILGSRTTERTTFLVALARDYPGWEGVMLGAGMSIGVLILVWSAAWLLNVLAVLGILGLAVVAVENLPIFADVHEMVRSSYEFRIAAVVTTALAIGLFAYGWRTGALGRREAVLAIGTMLVAAPALLALLNVTNLENGNPLDASALTDIVPAVITLPILPLLSAPLVIQWARHR